MTAPSWRARLFTRVRKLAPEGRVRWNIDDDCRWSYFFTDTDRHKLVNAGRVLEGAGYEVMGVLEPSEDNDDQTTIYLQVDRVETHTVDSLMARNAELYALAARHQLGSYDGMDVGAVEAPGRAP